MEKNIKYVTTTQDAQCEKYHTGLLCRKCKETYSLGFGSSQCLAGCSATKKHLNYFRILGLTVVCAVVGIVLVVFLTWLHLTVAEGTLNGLIFYANIVQVNLHIFFPIDLVLDLYHLAQSGLWNHIVLLQWPTLVSVPSVQTSR